MACYSPYNEFYLPRPWLISQCSGEATKNFVYGITYGAVMSALFSNPMPRAIRFTLGWGAAFTVAFTRPLYNSPGYLKNSDVFKPDFDRDSSWVTDRQIRKWYPKQDFVDSPSGLLRSQYPV